MKPSGMFVLAAVTLIAIALSSCGPAPAAPTEIPTRPSPTRLPASSTVPPPTPTVDYENSLEDITSAKFTNPVEINNKFFPLKPGTKSVFEGFTQEGDKSIPHSIVYTVTDLTKVIAGIRTVVVWILDYSDGALVEAEIAFYAQDDAGNVWFLGEYPEVYEDGQFVEAPAWITGYKGARAGIVMKADPQPGAPSYAQGWGPAVGWADRGQVIKTGEETCVHELCYENVLVTEEFSRSEANAFQVKYYAPDIGNIKVGWRGADASKEMLELTELRILSPDEMAEARAQALELERRAYSRSKEVYDQTSVCEYPVGTPAISIDPSAPPPSD